MKNLTPPSTTAKVSPDSYGLYIHFPWCLKKCPYCDFLSVAADRPSIPQQRYTEAILRELDHRRDALGAIPLHSVFFGGGTPSLWKASHIGRVLAKIAKNFRLNTDLEVTVECNPSSFSQSYADELQSAGANRVSIGVQGLDTDRLRFLGRLHDGERALRAVNQALDSKLQRVSADLIMGVFKQAPDQAVDEVLKVAELGVTHLSAYALTIEPGTQFGLRARQGRLPQAPDEQIARSFQEVSQALRADGFDHYEISNFARTGAESRHNLGYWTGAPYVGVGVGAWGTLPYRGSGNNDAAEDATRIRYRNTVSVERYMSTPEWPPPQSAAPDSPCRVDSPYQQVEPLSPETQLFERLMLGLRLAAGVRLGELEAELGVPAMNKSRSRRLGRLLSQGRIARQDDRLWIPHDAWLLADGTIAELL